MMSLPLRVTVPVILVQEKMLCMSMKTVDTINEIFVKTDVRGSLIIRRFSKIRIFAPLVRKRSGRAYVAEFLAS